MACESLLFLVSCSLCVSICSPPVFPAPTHTSLFFRPLPSSFPSTHTNTQKQIPNSPRRRTCWWRASPRTPVSSSASLTGTFVCMSVRLPLPPFLPPSLPTSFFCLQFFTSQRLTIDECRLRNPQAGPQQLLKHTNAFNSNKKNHSFF